MKPSPRELSSSWGRGKVSTPNSRRGNGREKEGEVETEMERVAKARSGGRRRSCNRCSSKKEKCNGEEPCERCRRADTECMYSNCRTLGRPRTPRALVKKRRPPKEQPGTGVRPPLKRATLSPSSSTGLAGLIEDRLLTCFLEDFVPFYPVVDNGRIRTGLINLMTGKVDKEVIDVVRIREDSPLGWLESCVTKDLEGSSSSGSTSLGTSSSTTAHRMPVESRGAKEDYALNSTLFSGMALGALLLRLPAAKVHLYIKVALTSLHFCGGLVNEQMVISHLLLSMAMSLSSSFDGDREASSEHMLLAKEMWEKQTRTENPHARKLDQLNLGDIIRYRVMVTGFTKEVPKNSMTPVIPVHSEGGAKVASESSESSGGKGGGSETVIPGTRRKAEPVRMVTTLMSYLGLQHWSPEQPAPMIEQGLLHLHRLVVTQREQLIVQHGLGDGGRRGAVVDYIVGVGFLAVLATLRLCDDMLVVAREMACALHRCPGLVDAQEHALHFMLAVFKAHRLKGEYDDTLRAAEGRGLPSFGELTPDTCMCRSPLCYGYVDMVLRMGGPSNRGVKGGGIVAGGSGIPGGDTPATNGSAVGGGGPIPSRSGSPGTLSSDRAPEEDGLAMGINGGGGGAGGGVASLERVGSMGLGSNGGGLGSLAELATAGSCPCDGSGGGVEVLSTMAPRLGQGESKLEAEGTRIGCWDAGEVVTEPSITEVLLGEDRCGLGVVGGKQRARTAPPPLSAAGWKEKDNLQGPQEAGWGRAKQRGNGTCPLGFKEGLLQLSGLKEGQRAQGGQEAGHIQGSVPSPTFVAPFSKLPPKQEPSNPSPTKTPGWGWGQVGTGWGHGDVPGLILEGMELQPLANFALEDALGLPLSMSSAAVSSSKGARQGSGSGSGSGDMGSANGEDGGGGNVGVGAGVQDLVPGETVLSQDWSTDLSKATAGHHALSPRLRLAPHRQADAGPWHGGQQPQRYQSCHYQQHLRQHQPPPPTGAPAAAAGPGVAAVPQGQASYPLQLLLHMESAYPQSTTMFPTSQTSVFSGLDLLPAAPSVDARPLFGGVPSGPFTARRSAKDALGELGSVSPLPCQEPTTIVSDSGGGDCVAGLRGDTAGLSPVSRS